MTDGAYRVSAAPPGEDPVRERGAGYQAYLCVPDAGQRKAAAINPCNLAQKHVEGQYVVVENGLNLDNHPHFSAAYDCELYALWYVLKYFPLPNLLVVTDSLSAIEHIKKHRPHKRDYENVRNLGLILDIKRLLEAREANGWTAEFRHIYSHQVERVEQNPQVWVPKIHAQRRLYTDEEWRVALAGNERADQLAKRGLTAPQQFPMQPGARLPQGCLEVFQDGEPTVDLETRVRRFFMSHGQPT
jgi:hypothetical protein